jgi:hypothetical protein
MGPGRADDFCPDEEGQKYLRAVEIFFLKGAPDAGKNVTRYRRVLYPCEPDFGLCRQLKVALVYGVRRAQSAAVCFHELVPYDVDTGEVRYKEHQQPFKIEKTGPHIWNAPFF